MNAKHRVDITNKIMEYMKASAKEMEEYYQTHSYLSSLIYFINNVKDGGEMDIKLQDDWKFEPDKIYMFRGMPLRHDDPGNINFGYAGAVMFPEIILCFGAGINQIGNWGFQYGDFSTFFDDPRDNKMIKKGYDIYYEVH